MDCTSWQLTDGTVGAKSNLNILRRMPILPTGGGVYTVCILRLDFAPTLTGTTTKKKKTAKKRSCITNYRAPHHQVAKTMRRSSTLPPTWLVYRLKVKEGMHIHVYMYVCMHTVGGWGGKC